MPIPSRRSITTLAGLAVIALAAAGAKVAAQPEGEPRPNPLEQNIPQMLLDTPGCLGIELAQTMSGKQVIFAWFENKKAAERWYWSEGHMDAMRFVGFEPGTKTPMEHVPDEGPIMVIASFTPGEESDENPLGVAQIAIELYQPIKGGADLGGRFSPEGIIVELPSE